VEFDIIRRSIRTKSIRGVQTKPQAAFTVTVAQKRMIVLEESPPRWRHGRGPSSDSGDEPIKKVRPALTGRTLHRVSKDGELSSQSRFSDLGSNLLLTVLDLLGVASVSAIPGNLGW
jgi:hypothetical protein